MPLLTATEKTCYFISAGSQLVGNQWVECREYALTVVEVESIVGDNTNDGDVLCKNEGRAITFTLGLAESIAIGNADGLIEWNTTVGGKFEDPNNAGTGVTTVTGGDGTITWYQDLIHISAAQDDIVVKARCGTGDWVEFKLTIAHVNSLSVLLCVGDTKIEKSSSQPNLDDQGLTKYISDLNDATYETREFVENINSVLSKPLVIGVVSKVSFLKYTTDPGQLYVKVEAGTKAGDVNAVLSKTVSNAIISEQTVLLHREHVTVADLNKLALIEKSNTVNKKEASVEAESSTTTETIYIDASDGDAELNIKISYTPDTLTRSEIGSKLRFKIVKKVDQTSTPVGWSETNDVYTGATEGDFSTATVIAASSGVEAGLMLSRKWSEAPPNGPPGGVPSDRKCTVIVYLDKNENDKFDVGEGYRLLNVIAVKVYITCPTGDDNVIESKDSSEYTCKILPDGLTATYSWLTGSENGAWPVTAGNDPVLDYSAQTAQKTKVKKTRWFAKTPSRRAAVDGTKCTYKLNCEVTIDSLKFKANKPKDMNVKVTFDETTTMASFSDPLDNGNGIQIEKDKTTNKWKVIGQGTFSRVAPYINMPLNIPESSQFYDKVEHHEKTHLNQFMNKAPWKDMWDADGLYNDTIASLTSTSKRSLWRKIKKAVTDRIEDDRKEFKESGCDGEGEAFAEMNDEIPDFLEYDPADWKKLKAYRKYNCK